MAGDKAAASETPKCTLCGTLQELSAAGTQWPAIFNILRAWIIHECRREAGETEARRGFSQVRATQAY